MFYGGLNFKFMYQTKFLMMKMLMDSGLLLWNQTRQQWLGNKRSQPRTQLREPTIRLVFFILYNSIKCCRGIFVEAVFSFYLLPRFINSSPICQYSSDFQVYTMPIPGLIQLFSNFQLILAFSCYCIIQMIQWFCFVVGMQLMRAYLVPTSLFAGQSLFQ